MTVATTRAGTEELRAAVEYAEAREERALHAYHAAVRYAERMRVALEMAAEEEDES